MDGKQILIYFWEECKNWSKGRVPYFRFVLWLYFVYVFVRHIVSPDYSSIFSGINLGIHELGHIVLIFMPTLIMVLGGTIFQICAPIASIFVFLKQRDYFAITVSLGWLSTSLFDVARYCKDAQTMSLPLVSPFGGEEIIHDWNYILTKLHILNFSPYLSAIIWLSGSLSMLVALLFGGAILLVMFQKR